MRITFRSFWILFNLTVATIIETPMVILIGFFDHRKRYTGALVRFWARWLMKSTGIPLEVRGLENVHGQGHYIFIGNHESALDIPVALASLPVTIVFLAKKELFRIPLFGWGMSAAGMVKVNRQNREQARTSVDRAVTFIRRRGVSVLIYPEGTRSQTGKLLPFKKGAFLLAIKTGLPVVPVTILGARDVVPKNSLNFEQGKITFVIGKPIPTSHLNEDDRNQLLEQVESVIRQEKERYIHQR